MSHLRRFDHAGITVADLGAVTAFFGEYENSWKMAYVRGPEGIIVSLAQHIG